jgi:Bacteriophage baseplate protein W
MNIAFPWRFDRRGRTAEATNDEHLLQMIELLLLTNPGERVNRPDFGSGLQQLVFAPNSPELAATVQYTMQAALQRYLGDVIALVSLNVTSQDAKLLIDLAYTVRSSGVSATAQFVVTP